jgi:putative endonuclease
VGRRELDIIAIRSGIVAFVEVKSRTSRAFGGPLEAITQDKQRDVARAAAEWSKCHQFPRGTLIRFDAVGVTWGPDGSCEIRHVEDAWYRE